MSHARVLIVGGAGYIGSTTAYHLADAGYEVHLLDNLSTGYLELAGAGPLHRIDLNDRSDLFAFLSSERFDAILHFAAFISVGDSVRAPLDYWRNNVAGTLNLLEGMVRHGIPRLVFSSTAAVYGEPREVPISEDHPLSPINPYGWTKRVMEQALAHSRTAYGLRSCALRYFNAAGADPSARCGEWHDPETHLIPVALRAAFGEGPPLDLFGEDYPTPDGTCIRDYIHVSDLAEAHHLALDYLLDGGETTAFNLGSEQGFSVAEVIRSVEQITGRPVPRNAAPRREGDPAALVASSRRIRSALGWTPHRSDLRLIVQDALNWHESHGFSGRKQMKN